MIIVFLSEGLIIYNLDKNTIPKISTKEAIKIYNTAKKDIIWILLDEKGAPSAMESQFQFHDWLLDSLRGKGFYVFDSLPSRYNGTIFSINSLFNLDDTIKPTDFMHAANTLKNNKWVTELKKQDYHFRSFDFLQIDSNKGKGALCLFPDNYINQILFGTAFPGIWAKISKNVDTYNSKIISELSKEVQQKHNYPQFIWSHLLIPHSPIFRNEKGTLLEHPIYNESLIDSTEIKEKYKKYNFYGNTVVLNILNKIPDWKNKIIVISGDHGARILVSKNDPRQFTTFAAIYTPNKDTAELKKIKYLQQIPIHLQ